MIPFPNQRAALAAGVLALLASACSTPADPKPADARSADARSATTMQPKRPNILIVVADDLGFGDIGPFGDARVSTPQLDAFSREALRMTNFHVQPTCSPTRAALLTGADNHRVGLGSMRETRDKRMETAPNYEGALNGHALTIAQVLKDNGYHTYMAGKWHLGAGPANNPAAQGFERSFALAGGGGSHWDSHGLVGSMYPVSTFLKDGKKAERPPGYSSDIYADMVIDWIRDGAADGKPFLAYLAFQAVHDPVQAPGSYIDKYKGKFDAGYDKARVERFENMLRMGVIPPNTRMAPRIPLVPEWSALSEPQRQYQARLMEVYAAMIDNMDHNFGRVVQYLKDSGQYDNTAVVFLSDNGPTPVYMDFYPGNADGKWISQTFDNRFDNIGREKSFAGLGPGWAVVGATPLRLFKFFQTEGGTLSPMMIKLPGFAKGGTMTDSFAAVEDLFPTLLDLSGATRPATRGDQALAPLKGSSMLPMLSGRSASVHPADYEQAQELWGSMYYRKGDWKLLWLPKPFGTGEWELYNMTDDRGETTNVAGQHPALVAELKDKYRQWAAVNGVLDWDYDLLFREALGYFDWTKGPLASPASDKAALK